MPNIPKVAELRQKALGLQLANVEILERYTDAALAEIYNGIGPDAFPEWLRKFISSLHPSLEAAALIHDVEWHASDKSREKFDASNERFRQNGYRIAQTSFGWYNPRRYLVKSQARRFSTLCELFGWRAWCSDCACSICKGKRDGTTR